MRDVREADAALRGGADLIDVKDPAVGPLGMAEPTTIHEILARVGDARPVTAALGELHEHDRPRPLSPRLRHVKLGLAHAPADWRDRLDTHFRAHSPALSPDHAPDRFIAVAYADHARVAAPSVADVLDWTLARGVAGLLIDTAVKDGRGLLHWCDPPTLQQWIETAHRRGTFIALAGSLDLPTIRRLLPLAPDIIAVRGAACAGHDRTAGVDSCQVHRLKTTLAPHICTAATVPPASHPAD